MDNYATWSVRMRFALISKGLWKHVMRESCYIIWSRSALTCSDTPKAEAVSLS